MNLPLNKNNPTIMHIDLNSCFATVEQQAYPNLRGKPIAIAAYVSPGGCVIAPSIEAKRFGVKVGMTVRDAKLLCRDIIIRDPDPVMVRTVHDKFKKLLSTYSPSVLPRSIDEFVIDFDHTPALTRGLINLGVEIKQEIRKRIGSWLSCNIGIGTNFFLAKLASNLHKPDGLDIITHENLKHIYATRTLIDLCGINTRYQARLHACGIFTPLEFLDASVDVLQKQVFQSINGYYWYLRLRGWEIDAVLFGRKSFGQSYALKEQTADPKKITPLLMKLCEKMGRRLRRDEYQARGIHISCIYTDGTYWHKGCKMHMPMYTTADLFKNALWVYNQQPDVKTIRNLAVSCFDLEKTHPQQMDLFDSNTTKNRNLTDALDTINNKYGEYVITPALMMGLGDVIIDRVAFGGL
jgi:DNA polymerase IV